MRTPTWIGWGILHLASGRAGDLASCIRVGGGKVRPEEAVGRILCPVGRRSFIWARRFRLARAAYPGASSAEADGGDGRPSTPLFGLAPHGVYHALSVTGQAVRSYRTLSPLPPAGSGGGLLSAALSLALPRPGVTRHAARRESGPSSVPMEQRTPAPSSRAFNIRLFRATVMTRGPGLGSSRRDVTRDESKEAERLQ